MNVPSFTKQQDLSRDMVGLGFVICFRCMGEVNIPKSLGSRKAES